MKKIDHRYSLILFWIAALVAGFALHAQEAAKKDAVPVMAADKKAEIALLEGKLENYQIQIDQLQKQFDQIQSKAQQSRVDLQAKLTDANKDIDPKKWMWCSLLVRGVFPGCTEDNDLQAVAVPETPKTPAPTPAK